MKAQSYFVKLQSGDDLHLKRFWSTEEAPAIFLLHGSIESGKIYYSSSGKGLGPFLANSGFDVWIPDLRGRGESKPPTSAQTLAGQSEAIIEEIPRLLREIKKITGNYPEHWIAHSWGGVLLSSLLIRSPEFIESVKSLTFLATKKSIRICNAEKFFKIDLMWNRVFVLLGKLYGFLPARSFGIGSENESNKTHLQTKEWVNSENWQDSDDGFDYGKLVSKTKFPPILSLTGKNDKCLGHPEDVRRFLDLLNSNEKILMILSKENGNKWNYDHVDILTHPDGPKDHFQIILKWLQGHETV